MTSTILEYTSEIRTEAEKRVLESAEATMPDELAALKESEAALERQRAEVESKRSQAISIMRAWENLLKGLNELRQRLANVTSEIAQCEEWIARCKANFPDLIGTQGFSIQTAAGNIHSAETALPMMREGEKLLAGQVAKSVKELKSYAAENNIKHDL